MKYIVSTFLSIFISIQLFAQTDENIFDKFTAQTIVIDGYKISIEVLGEGEPIFFFPGGPGNSHDYMQGHFGQYYKSQKVVFIDFLGRGMSDDPKDLTEYSIDNDVHITEEVRKALKLDKIIVVGHSYGSMIAQAYAIKYPDKVSKMVLIGTFSGAEMWQANCDNYNYNSKVFFPEYWVKVDSLRNLGYVSSDSIFGAVYYNIPTKYLYFHNTKINLNVPKKRFRGLSIDVYYAMLGKDADFVVGGAFTNVDFRNDLGKLNIPTLIMAGRYDGVSTPEFVVKYKEFMPKAKLVMFEQSGHNPYAEEPDKFFKIFNEFLGLETEK